MQSTDRLLGFVRTMAPVYAVAAAGFLLAVVVLGVLGATSEPVRVVASSRTSALVLPEGEGADRLVLYVRDADGQGPDVDCEIEDRSSAFVGLAVADLTSPSTVDLDGDVLERAGKVTEGWRGGEVVTCTGADTVVAAVPERAPRFLQAALCAFVGLGSLAFAVTGFVSRRRTAS